MPENLREYESRKTVVITIVYYSFGTKPWVEITPKTKERKKHDFMQRIHILKKVSFVASVVCLRISFLHVPGIHFT